MADLKRDPSHPLPFAISDIEVAIRLIAPAKRQTTDDMLNGATWYGESAEELLKLIRQGREVDEPPEPPPL
ncbi:MAG: hypothetical protein ACJ780_25085 [Solirubrobacteraceae bacterium]